MEWRVFEWRVFEFNGEFLEEREREGWRELL